MKKLMISFVMLFVIVSSGNSQTYDNNNYDNSYGYYEEDYTDDRDYDEYYHDASYEDNYLTYEYGYEAALPNFRVTGGPVYYFQHPYSDVYFVIINGRIFVIPAYRLGHMIHNRGWVAVPMERFIALSCYGLHYYDNYRRFHYYYDHYRRYRYSDNYNNQLRYNFRTYFKNRRGDRYYFNDWDRVMKTRYQAYRGKIDNRRLENPYNRNHTVSVVKVNQGNTYRDQDRYRDRYRDRDRDRGRDRERVSYPTGNKEKKVRKISHERNRYRK